jgi:hypothetical protein
MSGRWMAVDSECACVVLGGMVDMDASITSVITIVMENI